MSEEVNPIVNVIGTVADTAENTVDASHRAALAVLLPVIRQARDIYGVVDAGVDLAQLTVNDLLDRAQVLIETGALPK